jgi:hypothetical protein
MEQPVTIQRLIRDFLAAAKPGSTYPLPEGEDSENKGESS